MSIARLSYVVCDICGNPGPFGDDAKEARREARIQQGYRRREDGKDICPTHLAEASSTQEKTDDPDH